MTRYTLLSTMFSGISANRGQRVVQTLAAFFAACALSLALATTAPAAWTPVDPVDGSFDWVGGFVAEIDTTGAAQDIWVGEGDSATIERFTADGQSLIDSYDIDYTSPAGEIDGINGLAVDDAGETLYAVDQGNHRVVGFDILGESLSAVSQAPGGTPTECPGIDCPVNSTSPGQFSYPYAIAVHAGEVFVLDEQLRIQVFDAELAYLRTISNPDWFSGGEDSDGREPQFFTINPANGNLLVAISDDHGIEEYSPAGELLRVIPSPTSWPFALAIDYPNNVLYVVGESDEVLTIDYLSGQQLGVAADLSESGRWILSLSIQPEERILLVAYGEGGGDDEEEESSYSSGIERYAYDAAPTCASASAATQASAPVAVSLNCSDTSPAPQITYEIAAPPTGGTISDFNPATGTLTYSPSAGFAGTDTFAFRSRSLTGVSQLYTATISVVAIDQVPVIRQTANLSRSSGDIYVKLPGTDTWVRLEKNALVPVGTIIDAVDGYCVLTFANADGSLYSATFWGGVFQILQGSGDQPEAILELRDDEFPESPSQAAAASAASAMSKGRTATAARSSAKKSKKKSRTSAKRKNKKGKKKNKLWGKGKGKFRIRGNGSSASVRGTRWGVTNYENGTVTRVTEGVVVVRDFYRRKSIRLRRGKSYFADKNWRKAKKTVRRVKPRFTG
ncbi:MAG: Ig-like domain-containing protein [Solirubrobacterales bacterium]